MLVHIHPIAQLAAGIRPFAYLASARIVHVFFALDGDLDPEQRRVAISSALAEALSQALLRLGLGPYRIRVQLLAAGICAPSRAFAQLHGDEIHLIYTSDGRLPLDQRVASVAAALSDAMTEVVDRLQKAQQN